MSEFIGIDVGSSFVKAAIIDPDGLELRKAERAAFPEFLGGLPPLHREVEPVAIMRAVDDVLHRLGAHSSEFEGLVLCGQMHGFVMVDARGEAVSNYISWLDQRVSPAEFQEMTGPLTAADRAETGSELRPSIAAPLLCWLKRRGVLPGQATPVSIADFVAGRLCGVRPSMEPTQAAAFGALRLSNMRWHEGVIGKLGLDSIRWPEVAPAGTEIGRWRGAPCYASAGDQQCALVGALLGAGELSLNIGTGSQVAVLAADATSAGYQTRPFFDGRFLRTITHIPGGRALSALVGLLAELRGGVDESVWRHVEEAAAQVPVTDLRAGVAFFPGPCGHGGFLENLHEGNMSTGHVFRAVFEAMAGNYAVCARRLGMHGAGRVVFSGGVARRFTLLRELTAAALGLPYRLSPHLEDTLFGLMALAAAFSGRGKTVEATVESVRARLA